MTSRKARLVLVGSQHGTAAELLLALEKTTFDVEPFLVGPPDEVGTEVYADERIFVVHPMDKTLWTSFDMAVFCDPALDVRRLSREAREAGCNVLDLTDAFLDYPEIVPLAGGINDHRIPASSEATLLVAAPPLAVLACHVLHPLQEHVHLKRVTSLALASASLAGKAGMEALSQQTLNLYRMGSPTEEGHDDDHEGMKDEQELEAVEERQASPFHSALAFNILPTFGPVQADGISREEKRLVRSIRAILDLPGLPLSTTITIVPVFASHAMHFEAELASPLSPEEIEKIFEAVPGLNLEAPASPGLTPFHSAGRDSIALGRIRRDPSNPSSVLFWTTADNLGRCTAYNAVEIIKAWWMKGKATAS